MAITFSDLPSIAPGSHITLHYKLTLANGEVVLNTFEDKPATLLLGAGQLAPPLEAILYGLAPESHSVFELTPEQAFGERHADLVQRISLQTLQNNGMQTDDFELGALIEFNAPNGERYAGVLKEMDRTSALFDFNHPLAGQKVVFEVQIIGVI